MKIIKNLTTVMVSSAFILMSIPVKAELPPHTVVKAVYEGIQHIHGYKATPKLIWNIKKNYRGACGKVSGSHYCTLNHTIYIIREDIGMAYQFGDAALAYIVAHEYAHGMQTAYGFGSKITPISELQADCLAGVYLGLIPNIQFDERDIQEITALAYHLGDYAWGSQHHHGTPKQRVEAVVIGIKASVNNQGANACSL